MDAIQDNVIEIHRIPSEQGNTHQIFSTSHGIIDHTSSLQTQIVKIVKQHHSYTTSNENTSGFNLDSICTDTIGENFVAVAPTVSNEVNHNKSSSLRLGKGRSKMIPDEQSGNQASEKMSPVIMFKWGSVKKPFRCQICDMSFTDGNLLRTHLEKHKNSRKEPIKPFPCSLCTKSFQSNRSLERHQIMHSGQSQKRCRHCYKVFANKENLDKHLLMHSENVTKMLPCPSCNEQFTSRKLLEKHISTHWQIKSFNCHVCGKIFSRKDGLDRHLYTHDLGKRDKHKCVECPKSFSFLFALKRHVRSVHGGEPDGKKCEVCGKFIKNKENIGRHMQLHEGVRPFECPTCGKKFSQKQHMIDHMVKHTDSLPFQCKICSYSFRYRRTLSRHMKKHFKVDKDKHIYECLECHTTHTCEDDVIEHAVKSHYDFKDCIICNKTFNDIRSYRRHMTKEHNMAAELIHKKLVNKSTETDDDLTFHETVAEGEEDGNSRELAGHNQTYNECAIDNDEDKVDSVKNEFEYESESIDNLVKVGNVPDEVAGDQEIVYILYDEGKTPGSYAVIQNGVHITDFTQEQDQISKDAVIENQIIQISGTQSTSYELEGKRVEENATETDKNNAMSKEEVVDSIRNRVVEFSQGTDEGVEQSFMEIVGDPCMIPNNESMMLSEELPEKKVLYTYNVVVPKEEKEDGTIETTEEESSYSAERFKLLQSLIDYAEKIQEQPVSKNEEAGNSETQI